jgi:hypothetical protein
MARYILYSAVQGCPPSNPSGGVYPRGTIIASDAGSVPVGARDVVYPQLCNAPTPSMVAVGPTLQNGIDALAACAQSAAGAVGGSGT